MKLLIILLSLLYSVQAMDNSWDQDEFDYTEEILFQGDARFLNFSFDGVLNNSLLTLAGIFIGGVILFGKIISTLKSLF